MARLTSPAGPAIVRLVTRGDVSVLALPCRYSVTTLILAPSGVAIADLGSRTDVPLVLEALAALGRSPSEVRCIVPTHLHFDHVMGIDAFARRFGIPVALGTVAHDHVTTGRPLRFPDGPRLWRAILTWPMQGLPFLAPEDIAQGRDFGTPWGRDAFRAELAPPLRHGDPLPGFPGWTVLSTPGHSDDSICLHHAEAGFLVAGDTVRDFCGGEFNPLLVDPEAMERTKSFLRTLPVDTVFPGHGPVLEGSEVLYRIKTLPFFVP
jgi:glyoxylase-like metal-dependent hydrolase (beta-lactamase superfamily II)